MKQNTNKKQISAFEIVAMPKAMMNQNAKKT
jgi:hypothetical protein